MASGVNGYDSAAARAAEAARQRAEEERQRRLEEERQRAEKEAAEKAAQEAQEAQEAEAVEQAEEMRHSEETHQAALAESIWSNYQSGDINASEMVAYINALAEGYEFGPTVETQEYLSSAKAEEENIPEGLKELAQNYGIDASELSNPQMVQALKTYTEGNYDNISEYYNPQMEIGAAEFLMWYNGSYKPVEDLRHEMAAAHVFGLSQGMSVPSEMTQYELNHSFETQGDYYIASGDVGYLRYTTENNVFAGAENFESKITTNENGDTVSTISYIKDGKPVVVTTVFDGDSTNIKSQSQNTTEGTTNIEYGKDGSFVVTYPDGTDKTSAELTLTRINEYGPTIQEDMAGNNELSQLLVETKTSQQAFEALTAYCGGDKATARILFNAIYEKDGQKVDENFVLKNSKDEELKDGEDNPLYRQDQTNATARLFDYRNQDRVLSSSLLKQFATTSDKTIIADGVDTGFPESGTEYYIDQQGNLCKNSYTMGTDDTLNLYVTSVVTNTADDSPMYTETACYYLDEDGNKRVSVVRNDKDGNPVRTIDETVSEYQKRTVVERNYVPDTDGNGVSELDMSTEQINEMYSLMLQDNQYAEIIKEFGAELNSQGLFDKVHTFLVKTFDPDRVNTDKLSDEVVARTSMTPVLENFVAGNTREAREATEQEFERRLGQAETIQDIYDLASNYYGDEQSAIDFINEYLENNPQLIRHNAAAQDGDPWNYKYNTTSAKVEKDENGLHLKYTYDAVEHDYAYKGSEVTDLSFEIDSSKVTDKSAIEEYSDKAPNDFNSMYKFWSGGGEYNPQTVSAYNSMSGVYSSYNEGLMSAQSMEQSLNEAQSPDEVFAIFRQNSSSDAEAVEKFNNFYANVFEENPSLTLWFESVSNRCTGLHAEMGDDGNINYVLSLTDSFGNPIESPISESDIANAISGLNHTIASKKLLQREFSETFREKNYPGVEIPEGKDGFEYFTEYINNQYFDAYEKLFGDTELKNILQDYMTDMDTYASKLTSVVQMGAIGLSFVCPAFGMVAMAAGFIDNGIDLVNMATNKKADNYGEWLKQTGFEMFCVAGGMALGGLCNRIGGKVTELTLKGADGLPHALRAQVLGTAAEVGLDITSGMAFDYVTNALMYGETDWNLSGNMFSGMLDIISGIRGYHALKGSLDLGHMTAGASGLSTLMIPDGSGQDVEFTCRGVDANGRYVYSDGQGRVVVLDETSQNGFRPSDATRASLGDVSDNPYILNRLEQEGLVYNPETGTYRNADMKEVKIETFESGGTKYIRQTVEGEGYSKIVPAEYIRQGNDSNCGFLSQANAQMRTQEGVDSMFDGGVREYPDGRLTVATPDGQEIELTSKMSDGLSAVYGEAVSKVTGANGGFADDVARGMGLNPVRVEPEGANGAFKPEQLQSMADTLAEGGSLSVGVRYGDDSGHYMTVEKIDPDTGEMTVYDSATGQRSTMQVDSDTGEVRMTDVDTGEVTTYTPDEMKVEEVAGGASGEVKSDMNTPRADGSGTFGGKAPASVEEAMNQGWFVNAKKQEIASALGAGDVVVDMANQKITANGVEYSYRTEAGTPNRLILTDGSGARTEIAYDNITGGAHTVGNIKPTSVVKYDADGVELETVTYNYKPGTSYLTSETAVKPDGAKVETTYNYDTKNKVTSSTVTETSSDGNSQTVTNYSGSDKSKPLDVTTTTNGVETSRIEYSYDKAGNQSFVKITGSPDNRLYEFSSGEKVEVSVDADGTLKVGYPESEPALRDTDAQIRQSEKEADIVFSLLRPESDGTVRFNGQEVTSMEVAGDVFSVSSVVSPDGKTNYVSFYSDITEIETRLAYSAETGNLKNMVETQGTDVIHRVEYNDSGEMKFEMIVEDGLTTYRSHNVRTDGAGAVTDVEVRVSPSGEIDIVTTGSPDDIGEAMKLMREHVENIHPDSGFAGGHVDTLMSDLFNNISSANSSPITVMSADGSKVSYSVQTNTDGKVILTSNGKDFIVTQTESGIRLENTTVKTTNVNKVAASVGGQLDTAKADLLTNIDNANSTPVTVLKPDGTEAYSVYKNADGSVILKTNDVEYVVTRTGDNLSFENTTETVYNISNPIQDAHSGAQKYMISDGSNPAMPKTVAPEGAIQNAENFVRSFGNGGYSSMDNSSEYLVYPSNSKELFFVTEYEGKQYFWCNPMNGSSVYPVCSDDLSPDVYNFYKQQGRLP